MRVGRTRAPTTLCAVGVGVMSVGTDSRGTERDREEADSSSLVKRRALHSLVIFPSADMALNDVGIAPDSAAYVNRSYKRPRTNFLQRQCHHDLALESLAVRNIIKDTQVLARSQTIGPPRSL